MRYASCPCDITLSPLYVFSILAIVLHCGVEQRLQHHCGGVYCDM